MNYKEVIDYLIKNQSLFLSVLDKFEGNYQRKPDCLDFKIFYQNDKIDSLIAYTDYGAFYLDIKTKYIFDAIDFIENFNLFIFSIYGEDHILKKISDNISLRERNFIEYYMMEISKEDFEELESESDDILCRKCSPADFNILKKLQYLYHKEEVYSDETSYPYDAEMEAFKNLLKKRLNYALFNDKKQPVSKVNVNGESPDLFQIGGMFTLKEERKKGYAKICLNALLKDGFYNFNKKGIILFVRKNNIPAIQTYKKIGFKIIKETSILYF